MVYDGGAEVVDGCGFNFDDRAGTCRGEVVESEVGVYCGDDEAVAVGFSEEVFDPLLECGMALFGWGVGKDSE